MPLLLAHDSASVSAAMDTLDEATFQLKLARHIEVLQSDPVFQARVGHLEEVFASDEDVPALSPRDVREKLGIATD